MTDQSRHTEKPVPRLMREAVGCYRDAARRELAAGGWDDLPRNGGLVLAGLDRSTPNPKFSPQADAVNWLRVSKQSASQLIDTLVIRGYLDRRTDPDDRRRMSVRLTERGAFAAAAIQAAVDAVDAALKQRISAKQLQGLRAGLSALAEIREESSPTPSQLG